MWGVYIRVVRIRLSYEMVVLIFLNTFLSFRIGKGYRPGVEGDGEAGGQYSTRIIPAARTADYFLLFRYTSWTLGKWWDVRRSCAPVLSSSS